MALKRVLWFPITWRPYHLALFGARSPPAGRSGAGRASAGAERRLKKCFSTEFASAAERPARQFVGRPRAGGAPAARRPTRIPWRSTFRVARRRAVLVSRCPLLTRSLGAFLAGAFIQWCLYPGLYFTGEQAYWLEMFENPSHFWANRRKLGPRCRPELSRLPTGAFRQRRSSRHDERVRYFDV